MFSQPTTALLFALILFVGYIGFSSAWKSILDSNGGEWKLYTRAWIIGDGNIRQWHEGRKSFLRERFIPMSGKTLKQFLALDIGCWCHCTIFTFLFSMESVSQILAVFG